MDNPIFVTAAAGLIIFVAFFIRSLTGFGSALISIPLLAVLFELKFAVPLEALFEVGLSIVLLPSVYPFIRKATLVPLIIGALLGSLLGTFILYSFSNLYLKKALGAGVILFALHLIRARADVRERPPSSGWGLLAGGLGGMFGGLFGTSGPPYVIYLTYRLRRKEVLRASLIGLFAVDYAWRVGVYAATGLLTPELFTFALVLTPAWVLGTILGRKVHVHIGERRFMQTVAALLAVSGILLLMD